MTPMQKTILACVPNAEDGAVWAEDIAERLTDLNLSVVSVRRVLYHLKDAGIIDLDEMGYYRP